MRRIRLAGQLAEPISHYTDGVEAGGFLYVSGMLPLDANGDLVGAGDVVRQAEQVLDNVGDVLRAAGATFDDVVRVGVYLLNVADRSADLSDQLRALDVVTLRAFRARRPHDVPTHAEVPLP